MSAKSNTGLLWAGVVVPSLITVSVWIYTAGGQGRDIENLKVDQKELDKRQSDQETLNSAARQEIHDIHEFVVPPRLANKSHLIPAPANP